MMQMMGDNEAEQSSRLHQHKETAPGRRTHTKAAKKNLKLEPFKSHKWCIHLGRQQEI